MTELSASFYDEAMTEQGAPAMLPLDDSPWLPVYREAASWIPRNHPVVDLGCGTGRFLQLLKRNGHEGDLEGIDFSAAALQEAQRVLRAEEGEGRPAEWILQHYDLARFEPRPGRPGNTTYVCLEVLEHLELDTELVRRVPPGHPFIFSVPNYPSAGHVHVFPTIRDVWGRYDALLTFQRWTLILLDDRKAIHVVASVRRTDAW